MKTYRIVVETKFTTTFDIEADNEMDAEKTLDEMYEDGIAFEIEMEQCVTDTNYVSIEEINNSNNQ
jgi:hypothetical protein